MKNTLFYAFYISIFPLFLFLLSPSLENETLLVSASSKSSPVLREDSFINLAKIMNPAVVNIYTTHKMKFKTPFPNRNGDPFFDLFEQFFGPHFRNRPIKALGTGFIIREDGLILTNNHVVDRAESVKVQLTEKDSNIDAEVIGKDLRTDIALIKIKTKNKLPVAKLGSSKNVKPGQWVAAFGNPFGHGHTMTKGIVSAIGRKIDELTQLNHVPFIQTDAAINQGNSGGPLVNLQGEVIGVNTAIDARANGIGFAIPIDKVKELIPRLEKEGVIRRGFLGIYLENIDEEKAKALNLKSTKGALISHIIPGGPAEKASFKPYDFILKFDSKKIENALDLINAVSTTKIGKKVKVVVLRNGKRKTIRVKVGDHPEDKNIRLTQKRPSFKDKSFKAPFKLGFKMVNFSKTIKKKFDLPDIKKLHPVIVEVSPNTPASKASLLPGDIILDVNRKTVRNVKNVLKLLKKNTTNALRIMRKERVFLTYIKPAKKM